MTISTTMSSVTLLGNGVTNSFNFPFIADSASYISVLYTDSSGNITTLNPSQYTLSINSPATGQIWGIGGTVTYPISGSPIANGASLTIQRVLPLQQLTTISDQGNFSPEVIETALDTLEMQIQQVEAQSERAIQIPIVDSPSINTILPSASERANLFLGFDSAGNVITTTGSGGAVVSSGLIFGVAAAAGSLAAADNAASVTGGTLLIDTNVTLSANYTILSQNVIFEAGAITLGNYSIDFSAANVIGGFSQYLNLNGTGVPIFKSGQAVTIDWFGVNGVTDQIPITAAIAATPVANAADNNFTSPGSLVGRPGAQYQLTAGVIVNKAIHVRMQYSTINVPTTFTGIALDIKQGSGVNNVIYNVELKLPHVRKAQNGANSDWSEAATMIRLSNIRLSNLWVPQTYGGQKGLIIEADGTGFVENNIFLGRMTNAKTGMFLQTLNSGFVNSNRIIGGKCETATGAPVSTVGCVYLDWSGATGDFNNNNIFSGIVLETTDVNVTQAKFSGYTNIIDLPGVENDSINYGSFQLMSDSRYNMVRIAWSNGWYPGIIDNGNNNTIISGDGEYRGNPGVGSIGRAQLSACNLSSASALSLGVKRPYTVWIGGVAVVLNQVMVNPSSGLKYICIVAGTTGISPPTGMGSSIVDGTVTWSYYGEAIGSDFGLCGNGNLYWTQPNTSFGSPVLVGTGLYTTTTSSNLGHSSQFYTMEPMASTNIPDNTLFVDSGNSNKLSFRDSTGTLRVVTVV